MNKKSARDPVINSVAEWDSFVNKEKSEKFRKTAQFLSVIFMLCVLSILAQLFLGKVIPIGVRGGFFKLIVRAEWPQMYWMIILVQCLAAGIMAYSVRQNNQKARRFLEKSLLA